MDKCKVIILAAGEGTRMKSSLPKVLHKAAGKSLLEWVAGAARAVTQKPVVVYGSGAEAIQNAFGETFEYVLQEKRLGTGHAVMVAREKIKDSEYTLVLAGDMPLVRSETVSSLLEKAKAAACECLLFTASPEKSPAFGRIKRDSGGKICQIVEDKDATPEEKQIKELNLSLYCFKTSTLLMALDELRPDNAQREYYLTDCVQILYKKGYRIESESHLGYAGSHRRQYPRAACGGRSRPAPTHQRKAHAIRRYDDRPCRDLYRGRCNRRGRYDHLSGRYTGGRYAYWLRLHPVSGQPARGYANLRWGDSTKFRVDRPLRWERTPPSGHMPICARTAWSGRVAV